MIQSKGYAAHNQISDLVPFSFERRELNAQDVLIEIEYCGVCHSDIHQVKNEWLGTIYPIVPGHEIVGKIIAIGEHVSKFKIGDRAGVGCFVDSCRTCNSCQDGLEQYCEKKIIGTYNGMVKGATLPTYGGYSNNIVVDENYTLKIPNNLTPERVAPLLCAGITTYSPLRHWNVGKNSKVAVLGLGGLGHMAVKFAVSFGADVTVLSSSPNKYDNAMQLGAQHFANTSNQIDMQLFANQFDIIINTVSAPHDINSFLHMLKRDGTMVILGVPPTATEFFGFSLVGKRRNIAGSMIGGINETQEMLNYCAEHNIMSDVEVIKIQDINIAYKRVMLADVKYRFVIDMKTL